METSEQYVLEFRVGEIRSCPGLDPERFMLRLVR